MSTNGEYQAVYRDVEPINQARERYDFLARNGQKRLDALWLADRKQLGLKKNQPSSEGSADRLRAVVEIDYPATQAYDEVKRLESERDDKLERLSRGVDFQPGTEWHTIRLAYRHGYPTQTQPKHYSRGVLVPLAGKLAELGIDVDITVQDTDYFVLRARCEPWMADAANRLLTMADTRRYYRASGHNIRVYHPGLKWLEGE